ncbi:hypothetical protein [Actinoplanes sp. NPDC026619]|uniref:hypothetical protein n=1 Tax=Actinoplanes sp. NPDC026619 TaxID=3155798 RepID=UPI0033F8CE45
MPPPGYQHYAPPPGYQHYPPPPGHQYYTPGYGVPTFRQLPTAFYASPDDPLVSADLSGWWTRSFRLVRAAWRPIALFELLAAIPLIIFLIQVEIQTNSVVTMLDSADIDWGGVLRNYALMAPTFLIALVFSMIATLASLQVLVQQATGRPLSIGEALRTAMYRLPALIGWGIPAGLMVLAGIAACFLPGIYLLLVIATFPTVVLLERGNPISRVFALFHADLGASLIRALVTGAVIYGLQIGSSIITNPITAIAGQSTATTIVTQVIAGLITAAGTALAAAFQLTTYADLRARFEPFSTAYLLPR